MELITTLYENDVKQVVTRKCRAIKEIKGVESRVVNLYPELTYQTFFGFGGAVTEAAGYAYSKLSKELKEEAVKCYYGESGNGYRMVRSHIDSCDFSLGVYSAMTDPSDTEMKSFTLERDEQYILPLLKAVKENAGDDIEIMLSPWSPPAFMKTNGEKLHGGKLKPEYRKLWAEYVCRYIKEYEKRGYNVSRITIQNEPAAVQTWDSCIYTAQEEKEFLRDYLYPTLVEQDLGHIKLFIWDHNKELMFERARAIIDETTDSMVSGVAFHWYTGDHFEAIHLTGEAFPAKELIFTEGCVEYSRFGKNQLENAQMYAHDILGNLNNGMNAFIDWNLFLDEKGGPNHAGNHCDAPIMVDTEKGTFRTNLSYDYIGHFSRYIRPGAKRIGLTKYSYDLEATAFLNTDGSIVMVALNRTGNDIPVVIRSKGSLIEVNIAKNAIATLRIPEGEIEKEWE